MNNKVPKPLASSKKFGREPVGIARRRIVILWIEEIIEL